MGKTMNRNYAAFFAMAAMVSAPACGKAEMETDSSEHTITEPSVVETSGAKSTFAELESIETESIDGIHGYSTGDLKLDCVLGFENLTAYAIAMDGMELAAETEEQIAYITPDGVSFTLTKETHYAHPMIIRRDVVLGDGEEVAGGEKIRIDMAACGYGTKESSDRMMEAFALLNKRYILSQKIRIIEE